MVKYEEIEQIAADLLKKEGTMKIPVDLHFLAEQFNIIVDESDPGSDELSGVLSRGLQAKILINKSHSKERKRFTLAHELGHFFLHKGKEIFVDSSKDRLLFRSTRESENIDSRLEQQANVFAAALLMPTSLVEKNIKDYVKEGLSGSLLIEKMSKKFEVSEQAMSFRLLNLGYEFH